MRTLAKTYYNGAYDVIWTEDQGVHHINYGNQLNVYDKYSEALAAFKAINRHAMACAGMFDIEKIEA